jgi:hypothetical protein
MRNAIKAVAAGAAIIMMTIGASYAAPVSNAHLSGGAAFETGVLQVQYGHCERLRYKCQHKYELGQEGEGNCQRYREECGGRASYCERLRRACEHKYERGEEGQGNCRRYREECGR